MKYRLSLVLLLSLLSNIYSGFSQIGCDTIRASMLCQDAPVICSINCLDGFTDRMPDTTMYKDVDPDRKFLCRNSGSPNNLSWFAFLAGSSSVELEVTLTNCLPGQNVLNVQSGILASCNLDDDGRPLIGEELDCYNPDFNTPFDPVFRVSSDQFIPGQVYYFFIDGTAGTQCTYTIDVIQGEQPNPLDEITEIVTGDTTSIDTFCLGLRDVILHPNTDSIDLTYMWSIKPATLNYPDTNFISKGYSPAWTFNSAGEYTISVFAFNECDMTDTFSQVITVLPIEPEIFDTIDICFNDFPYAGPLTDDPNMDGVIGWLGPQIQYPGGTVTHNVQLQNGCSYNQIVTVNEIAPQPRQRITLNACNSVDFNGVTYNSNVTDIPITIDNGNAQGCDSLISLTVNIIDYMADIGIVRCDSTGLLIGLENISLTAPTNAMITYKWFNSTGEITDNDANGNDILITSRDSYRAEVSIIMGSDTCIFQVPPTLIDPNDNKPTIDAIDWSFSICDNSNIGKFIVISDQPISLIEWQLPTGATIIESSALSDSIFVDFSNSTGGTVMATVYNFCSGFATTDFPVSIVETPIAEFSLPTETCIDSAFELLSLETNSAFQYFWSIPNNSLITSGTLNSPGPLEVEFKNTPGSYPIQLIVANGACRDTLTKTLQLVEPITPLSIDCTPTASSIDITWNTEQCAEEYIILNGGQEIGRTTDNSFTIDNLPTDTDVEIQVAIVSNCLCAGPITTINCRTLDCSGIDIEVLTNDNFICEDQWLSDHQIQYVISGNTNGNFTWRGNYINQDGQFNAIEAGQGVHQIILTYEEQGCIYSDSIEIELYDNPTAEIKVYDPQCIDDLIGTIDVLVNGGDGNYRYSIDGNTVPDFDQGILPGEHTIEIIDGNSCQVIKTFTIMPPPTINYQIEGEMSIYESQTMNIDLLYDMSEIGLIDSIVWLINEEVYCTGLIDCSSISIPNPEVGEYKHQILIYYNDCLIEELYFVTVKENSKLYIPQIFSPNDDGNNDDWFIQTNDPTLVVDQIVVFDRWGNTVFTKEDFNPALEIPLWNGTLNGTPVLPGVYVYTLTYKDEFGKSKTISRDLTIVR